MQLKYNFIWWSKKYYSKSINESHNNSTSNVNIREYFSFLFAAVPCIWIEYKIFLNDILKTSIFYNK